MKTFTQMKQAVADYCGLYVDAKEMTKVADDINNGAKLFQNAARRYYTRRERKTDLKANQQYYQFPSDMLRVANVKCLYGSYYAPLKEIKSEDEWISLCTTVLTTTSVPTYFFIKGADEVGLFPVPNEDVKDGLVVTFEPRMVDMSIEDIEVPVTLVEGSNTVTATGDATFPKTVINNCYLTNSDGSDGNWYKVSKYIDEHNIWIDNYYQGLSDNNATVRIGQCPQFPEEYHDAPIYYACQQFFTLRKDLESASYYKQMFDDLYERYRAAYGNKASGGVVNPTKAKPDIGINVAFPWMIRG